MAKWDKYIQSAIEAKQRFNDIAGKYSDNNEPVKVTDNKLKYDVVEILPNRDKPDDIYLLNGNDTTLPSQISLFLALEEMVSVRIGSIDLKDWAEKFESEFIAWEGKHRPKNNAENPWGKPYAERPRLEIVTLPNKQNLGYLIAQYWPNRNNDNEYYWCSGSATQIVNQVMQLHNNRILLESKDLGQFLGWPVAEYAANYPAQYSNIKIFLTNRKQPPYYKGSGIKLFVKTQVNIPCVDESKLTYENIRNICNGSNGLNWVHWHDRAYIAVGTSNKIVHQMVAWGNSQEAAKANLDKFLKLTKGRVVSRGCTEADGTTEKAKADIDWEDKNNFDVYPWFMTVCNPVKVKTRPDKGGKATRAGTVKHKFEKLFLNTQSETKGWATALRKVLSSKI